MKDDKIQKEQSLFQEYEEFRRNFRKQIYQYDIQNQFSEIVFLCIGTNKVVGDMIGPMVGEKLGKAIQYQEIGKCIQKDVVVYGNMKQTLNLKNAEKMMNEIKYRYYNPFLITIDTALGKKETIEKIFISTGEIEIGKALKRGIKCYSHINIKGVIGKYSKKIEDNLNTLKNANVESVERMSEIIYDGIKDVIKNLSEEV